MTVVLYAGDGSAISDACAAALWGFPHFPKSGIHITASRNLRAAPFGAVVHRRRPLMGMERSVYRGIPITSVPRTLLDNGSAAPVEHVEDAVDHALRLGMTKLVVLRWVLDNIGGPGNRGSATLRKIVDERQRSYVPPESVLEGEFLRLLRKSDLPMPTNQVVVEANGRFLGRIDFLYGDALAIEVDGAAWHLSLNAWENDLRR